jgi:hypothetical protein
MLQLSYKTVINISLIRIKKMKIVHYKYRYIMKWYNNPIDITAVIVISYNTYYDIVMY